MKRLITFAFSALIYMVGAAFIAPAAHAVTPTKTVPAVLAVTPTPTPIEYVLPYPGILPTHPLFIIKSLRDRIIEMLISDPVSKADFHILQADKKLNMALTLRNMNKTKDAKTAFDESLSSRTMAVSTIETFVKSGGKVPVHIMEKLSRSIRKHEEVLVGLKENSDVLTGLNNKLMQMTRPE